MKIAYCGYDFFVSCFDALTKDGHTILRVFSNPCDNKYDFNLEMKKRAKKLGVSFTTKKITEKDIQKLQKMGCDLIVTAAYPFRVPVYPGMPRSINIHPTLLPVGRGPWPLPWIILKGLKESGVTIHKIEKDFDTGNILHKKRFLVTEQDTLETISAKSQIMAPILLSKLVSNLDTYWTKAQKQSSGSYWKMPAHKDRTLDWNSSVMNIDRIIRAFGKFESYAHFDNKDWLVRNAVVWKEKHAFKPGLVVQRMSREVVVAVKDGFVCLLDYVPDRT